MLVEVVDGYCYVLHVGEAIVIYVRVGLPVRRTRLSVEHADQVGYVLHVRDSVVHSRSRARNVARNAHVDWNIEHVVIVRGQGFVWNNVCHTGDGVVAVEKACSVPGEVDLGGAPVRQNNWLQVNP